MINYSLLLTDGMLVTLVFTLFVGGTMYWKPRLWLQDFPKDIQALIPPKTPEEKRLTSLIAIPWFMIFFGSFVFTSTRFRTEHGFLWMLIHTYLVWQIVNLFDLVVIDWVGMNFINPDKPPFPGTERAKGYRDYKFHFIGFLKGSVIGLVISLVVCAVVWLVIA